MARFVDYTTDGVQGIKHNVELEYFEDANPRSVVNIVPPKLQEIIRRCGSKIEETLYMDEHEFRRKYKPTPTLNRLRISFWKEYDVCQARNNKTMVMIKVYNGIIAQSAFYRVCEVPLNLAWILKPPVDYQKATEEALLSGIDRLREILELPLTKIESVKIGKDEFEDRTVVDTKAAELLLKVTMMLDMRVKGAVAQRQITENRNLNANVNYDQKRELALQAMPEIEESELDKKIAAMEDKLVDDMARLQKPIRQAELQRVGMNIDPLETGVQPAFAFSNVDKIDVVPNEVGRETQAEIVNRVSITDEDAGEL